MCRKCRTPASPLSDSSRAVPSTSTAEGDLSYTTDIPDNAGIAIFRTTDTKSFTLANRLDAVGPTSEANAIYKEGTGYAPVAVASVEFSIVRKIDALTGLPTDTGNNATDFRTVATNANASLATASLGAPGPENLTAPVNVAVPTTLAAGHWSALNCVLVHLVTPATL